MDIFESLEEKCDYWHDVPFMTKNWKKAIRDKGKAAKAYANNRIEEN
ncbi:unnamed protein product, partial [Porites evermanni]